MAAGTSQVDESVFHDMDWYFDDQVADTPRFWRRLGGPVDVAGLDVLDFGCGHGALSLDAAERGARSVLGIDLSTQRIDFARRVVAPRAAGRLAFECVRVEDLPRSAGFDVILSKNTMEHVSPLGPTIAELASRLRPGGRLALGFSPLWYSPWGDHGELGTRIPWAHVVAGERAVLARFNERNQSLCGSLPEAGYNMATPAAYAAALAATGMIAERFTVNAHEGGAKGVLMDTMRLLRNIPGLEPFMTVGMYGVWRKAA
jgi:SAM-dependent methyltransferase